MHELSSTTDPFVCLSVCLSHLLKGLPIFAGTWGVTEFKKGVRNYNQASMDLAIQAVLTNQMKGEAAAKQFGVPRSTLYRLVKKTKDSYINMFFEKNQENM